MATAANFGKTASGPFSETYAEARGKFRQAAQAAVDSVGGSSSLSSRVLEGVVGSEGEELALDFALIGGPGPCSSLYLLTAGQHGVEGYLGSAIQIDTLKWLADAGKGALPEGCWIVMVHVMNPHGMSWWRRWNEENCDLNRNFLPDGNFLDLDGKTEATHSRARWRAEWCGGGCGPMRVLWQW